MRGETLRARVLHDRRDLVAEAEDAARLEADDRNAAREERIERRQHALGFGLGFVDLADGEKGTAATERAWAAVGRRGDVDGVAAGNEHGEGRVQVLALEVAVEGVGEEDDVCFPSPACGGGTRAQRARRGQVGRRRAWGFPLPALPRKRGRGRKDRVLVLEKITAPARQ